MKLRIEELSDTIPGIDAQKYFYAWKLLAIAWRGLWWGSRTDWSRYRKTIWDMFGGWVVSSARKSRDVAAFISHISKYTNVSAFGTNEDERQEVVELLSLPDETQRAIIRQFRDQTPVLMALLRQWRDRRREEAEIMSGWDTTNGSVGENE